MHPSIKTLVSRARDIAKSYYGESGAQGHIWVNAFTVWASDVLDGSDRSAQYAESTRKAIDSDPTIDDCTKRALMDTTLAVEHLAKKGYSLSKARITTAMGYFDAISPELRAQFQEVTNQS